MTATLIQLFIIYNTAEIQHRLKFQIAIINNRNSCGYCFTRFEKFPSECLQ